jgi:hypothetical protein
VRIIVEPPRSTRPDPMVEVGTLATRVQLSPNVTHVKAGTPLRPSGLGWEPDTDGANTVLFASNAGYGGSLLNACREAVLHLNPLPGVIPLTPGARYKVGDIDATGFTTFEPASDGPYTALTDRTILLTPVR